MGWVRGKGTKVGRRGGGGKEMRNGLKPGEGGGSETVGGRLEI